MIFKVEVDDFWLDEEEISEALKRYITNSVVQKIEEKYKKQFEEAIVSGVNSVVKEKLAAKFEEVIEDVCKTGRIQSNSRDDDEGVLLGDWIKNQFENNSGWRSPNEYLEKLAKQFSKELKDRYDLIFASHMVAKINDQGMLKDDVAKLLLGDLTSKK